MHDVLQSPDVLELFCWTHSSMSVSFLYGRTVLQDISLVCQMEGNNHCPRTASLTIVTETQYAVSLIRARAQYQPVFNFLPTRNPQFLQSCFLSSQHPTCTLACRYLISNMMASEAVQWPHQQRAQSHSTQPGRAERDQGG